jgi:hypothetical protein
MNRYQIRVLQPAASTLAVDLARFIQTAAADYGTVTVRTYPSSKHHAHNLVYIDLFHTGIQKGQEQ